MHEVPACVIKWERLLAMKPPQVPSAVWKGAVALALVRHPNAAYPQPQDQADALTVLSAAAPIVL